MTTSKSQMRGAQNIEMIAVEDLIPYARNARIHSDEQVAQIASSIQQFGFNNPVLIDAGGGIIAGHGRVMAARRLGLKAVPCVRLGHLSEAEKRAYIIADNAIAENSSWDRPMLESELDDLLRLETGIDFASLGLDVGNFAAFEQDSELEPESGTSEVADVFWISIVGPLKHQARVLDRLRAAMADIEPVTVELGTVAHG